MMRTFRNDTRSIEEIEAEIENRKEVFGNHRSGNAALDKALDMVGAAFREARKMREDILLRGRRVEQLVEAKRNSYPEACRMMNVTCKEVNDALSWLVEDNEALNAQFGTEMFYQRISDHILAVWLEKQEEALPTAQIISFKGAA